MDIFDGLHPKWSDSIDVDDSDTSDDEVVERLVTPLDEDNLARLIVTNTPSFPQKENAGNCNIVPHLWPIACQGPRGFLSLAHSVESPGWFLAWARVLFFFGGGGSRLPHYHSMRRGVCHGMGFTIDFHGTLDTDWN